MRLFRHRHKKDVFLYSVPIGLFNRWRCRCGEEWTEHV